MNLSFKKTYNLKINIPPDIIIQRLKEITSKETIIRTDLRSDIPFRGTIDDKGFSIRKTYKSFRFYPVKIKGVFNKTDNDTNISLTYFPEPIFYVFRIVWLTILLGLILILVISSFVEPLGLIAIPFLLAFIFVEEYIFRNGYKKGIKVTEEIIYRLLEIEKKIKWIKDKLEKPVALTTFGWSKLTIPGRS